MLDFRKSLVNSALREVLKRLHYPLQVMLTCVDILMRQNKYLNNIVEQDHRAIKRITRPMLGFKSFGSARIIIAGSEVMHMIKKG